VTHFATSRVLEEMIIEFRKKGLAVPQNVLDDIKSARVLMKVEEADDRGRGETSPKIDEFLGSVEAYLVTEAQKKLPPEKIDEWLRKLEAAGCDTCMAEEKDESRFIPGLPRNQKWVRVKPLASLPAEKLKEFAADLQLSVRSESDGHLLVFGSDEGIKAFVKKMTSQAAT
jgi:hypothetical protein